MRIEFKYYEFYTKMSPSSDSTSDIEILFLIREKVFAKWEKYRYNREFYLAPTDIYRELEIYPVELKKRVEGIVLKLRKEREESEIYKK